MEQLQRSGVGGGGGSRITRVRTVHVTQERELRHNPQRHHKVACKGADAHPLKQHINLQNKTEMPQTNIPSVDTSGPMMCPLVHNSLLDDYNYLSLGAGGPNSQGNRPISGPAHGL